MRKKMRLQTLRWRRTSKGCQRRIAPEDLWCGGKRRRLVDDDGDGSGEGEKKT